VKRSNLGDLRQGSLVNLERALLATTRLSGHIVQGHVDGTGEFLEMLQLGDRNWWLKLFVPEDLDRYLVSKGSVAIDGVSLTVASIASRVLSVTIIPHTYENTSLRDKRRGDRLNLECDILAKHIEKLMSLRT
jgi:riboflavin synthase